MSEFTTQRRRSFVTRGHAELVGSSACSADRLHWIKESSSDSMSTASESSQRSQFASLTTSSASSAQLLGARCNWVLTAAGGRVASIRMLCMDPALQHRRRSRSAMQAPSARDPNSKEAGGSKVALGSRADPLNCLKLLFSGEWP